MKSSRDDENDVSVQKTEETGKAALLGLGLDNKDGHVRVTQGPNFHLVGGSSETHEAMQETAVKLNEELKRQGKRLEQVEPRELRDILAKVTPRR